MTNNKSEWYLDWFNSPFYHLLYKERDSSEATYFMNNLINKLQIDKNSSILDLACGRGRYSLYLSNIGHKVTGIDISKENISEAKKNESDKLNYILHDMRYPLNQKFDLILNLFTSFGYYEKDTDNLSVIKSIKSNLETDGQAVIDFFNIDYILDNLVEKEEKNIDKTKFIINRYLENDLLVKDISILLNNKSYKFQEKVKAYRMDDFLAMFKNCNLKLKEIYGDYKLNSFNKNSSNRLIMVFN
ncbi:MAG: class I SAM-dependent methyltransferase [Flavobacteriaceae bacterium]|jgi:SAM-dependent methyltransferase|nr:class I SAM-dependent methyltransferase [Flavobacteriaceae bacterium]